MEDRYNHVDFTKDDLKYVEESDDDENGKIFFSLKKPSFLSSNSSEIAELIAVDFPTTDVSWT
jgi:hypothetical protein